MPPKLTDNQEDTGCHFRITLFVQAKVTERTKHFTFANTGIKTGLLIRTENEIRPTYTINIPSILK